MLTLIRRLFCLAVFAAVMQAEIANVQVVGATNVQAVLSYRSPVDGACAVEISEAKDLRPLVHDVDPALFGGADADTRPGNPVNGRERAFVIGRRGVAQAKDGKWYSLALQTDTVHYYRIRCGSDTASGTFRTANIPVGVSYPWPIPQDPKTGNFRWPSVNTDDRNQTIIDPNYGTLIRRVTIPGDGPGANWSKRTFASVAGRNWNVSEGGLEHGAVMQAAANSERGWLVLTDAKLQILPYQVTGQAVDSVVVRISGASQGPTERDRTVEVCLTTDGATCRSEIRTAVLDGRESVKTLGSGPVDTWGAVLWQDELKAPTFGVMIRPAAGANGRFSIRHVEMDIRNSGMGSLPENGFLTICAATKSNGGFHCSFRSFGGNGANALYWIQPETGEVRPLGTIVATGWGGSSPCATNWAAFDKSNPDIYYCGGRTRSGAVLLRGKYIGKDRAAKPGEIAKFEWENLTPEPDTIGSLIKAFNPEFDPAQFDCSLVGLAGHHALFTCKMGFQDSLGWLAALDVSKGKIVAAAKSYASPNSRWCGIHATEQLDLPDWFGWGAQRLVGGGPRGTGPYSVTLQSEIPAQTGSMTIRVSGEPEPRLMDTAPGDIFHVMARPNAFDILRIARKKSATEWVVERFVPYGAPVIAVPAGTKLNAFCNGVNPENPKPGVQAYWNFLADPRGEDATNTKWVAEKILTGGHLTQRGNYRIMVDHRGYQIITPGAPASFNHPVTFTLTANPRWNNVRAWVGLGDERLEGLTTVYQGHPSYENFREQGHNNWFVDLIPFVGSPAITAGLAPAPGLTQVYAARGVRLNRGVFPTFAICGGRQLKDISPGPIRDADQYSYCVGAGCVSGAGATDVFVNCPAPVGPASRCLPALAGNDSSVCVGDMAPYGQSITQFFLDPSGIRNRVLTNGLFPWQSRHTPLPLNAAFALPDGSWILFPSYGSSSRKDVYMVKVPAQPEFDPDPGKWTRPVPVPISATPPAAGVARAVLQYGPTAELGSTAPFAQCRSGGACSITVNARPLELVFSRVLFQDAGGKTIAEGPIEVRVSSGTRGAGIEKHS